MPNINDWLNNILTARYGEEVRGSIYNSIKLFNDIVNETSSQFNQDAAAVAAAVNTAQTAATTATTAKTAAETAKTAAETAKTAAETAKTAAETAKTGAEKAKTDAGAYADITAGYVNEANAAATRAESARDDTIEAKDVSVAAILQQQAESAQAVINTGNTVKDEITAKTTESVNAVKTQETASKAAVTAAGDEVADAITAKTTEAVAAVGVAEADALQKIGNAADDIISGGDSVYVKKTGDTITGIVKAPAPLENADNGQLATVGFVKSNSTKNAVTKEGTSVVIGDIQVPNPENESSVVPRGYVEDNFITKNSANSYNLGLGYRLLADAGPIDSYGISPSYFVCSSTFLVQGYTQNAKAKDFGILRFVIDSRKEPAMIFTWDYSGNAINSDYFLMLHKFENNKLYLKVVFNQTIEYRGVKLVCLSSQQSDGANKDIPWHFYSNGRLDAIPEDFISTPSSYSSLKVNEIFSQAETPSAGNSLVPRDYADSVPYQYAKAAGFFHDERTYKHHLRFLPAVFDFQYINNSATGYKKLATSQMAVNNGSAAGSLIIEGCIRHWGSTSTFKIVLNNRLETNAVSFEGLGYKGIRTDDVGNLVVVKNSENKYEAYFEKISTDSNYQVVLLRATWDGPEQWDIENLTDTTLTPGTIPGTKVWDLKTAWGTTSRTQITKEEADNTYFKKKNPVTLQPRTTGYFAEPVQFLTPNNNGTTAARAYLWGQYNSTDNEAIFYLAGTDASGKGYNRIRMSNLKAPKVASDAVPYDFLKTYVSANAGGFEPNKNAGAHNSIFRGKYLGTSFTLEQAQSIKNAHFDDLFIGDYWEDNNGIAFRIAAFCYYREFTSATGWNTRPAIILVPDKAIGVDTYNATGQNVASVGYRKASIRTSLTSKLKASSLFKTMTNMTLCLNKMMYTDSVVTTTSASDLGAYKYVSEMSTGVELMSQAQLFGFPYQPTGTANYTVYTEHRTDRNQFPLFRLAPEFMYLQQTDYSITSAGADFAAYWLRDIENADATPTGFNTTVPGGEVTTYRPDDILALRPYIHLTYGPTV